MKKRLEVKDWFLNKLANEKKMNIHGNADVIFKETEKAYQIMFDCVSNTFCSWVPKAVCEWVEFDENDITKRQNTTEIVNSFAEAQEICENLRFAFC